MSILNHGIMCINWQKADNRMYKNGHLRRWNLCLHNSSSKTFVTFACSFSIEKHHNFIE